MVEGDRLPPLFVEALVDEVEHVEKRHPGTDVVDGMGLEASRAGWASLTPDVKGELHL
jgi:hypothetical protein